MATSGKRWAIRDSQGAKRRNSERSTAHRECHTIRPPSLRCQKEQAKRRSLVFSLKKKNPDKPHGNVRNPVERQQSKTNFIHELPLNLLLLQEYRQYPANSRIGQNKQAIVRLYFAGRISNRPSLYAHPLLRIFHFLQSVSLYYTLSFISPLQGVAFVIVPLGQTIHPDIKTILPLPFLFGKVISMFILLCQYLVSLKKSGQASWQRPESGGEVVT